MCVSPIYVLFITIFLSLWKVEKEYSLNSMITHVHQQRQHRNVIETNHHDDGDSLRLPTLLLTAAIQQLRRYGSLEHDGNDYLYIAAAGSHGYGALKEMLQNGIPGNTTMIESHDVQKMGDVDDGDVHDENIRSVRGRYFFGLVSTDICASIDTLNDDDGIQHLTVYSNEYRLPRDFLSYLTGLTTVDLSPLLSRCAKQYQCVQNNNNINNSNTNNQYHSLLSSRFLHRSLLD